VLLIRERSRVSWTERERVVMSELMNGHVAAAAAKVTAASRADADSFSL
jgi:hypothetical protein